ncbi:MAG: hypothetical protein V7644_588 [Actinomycetota bacterium]|jgi:uncharacterized membrane protein
MKEVYRRAVLVFGLLAIALGLAIVVQTARAGGGAGYAFGCLFVAVGAGRLYLLRRRDP